MTIDLGSLVEETVLVGPVGGVLPGGFDAPLDADGAQLVGTDLHQARIVDGRWQSTSLSATTLASTTWEATRLVDVEFENCDLTGAQFLDKTTMERVTFTNCKLAYSNWFDCVLGEVRFEDCHLSEARLASMTLRGVSMVSCTLDGSTFDRVSLGASGDLDLRGSAIEDTKGLAYIRGLRVDTAQAAAIGAALLDAHGIVVDDGPDR